MKRKIMTITYTCPEDKINLGEADIMGYILQRLGELEAYDITMRAGSTNIVEPAVPKVQEREIQIPMFLQRQMHKADITGLMHEGEYYGKTVQVHG